MKPKMLLVAAATAGLGTTAQAADVAPSMVKFTEYGAVEASLTGVPGDAERGAAVFADRKLGNCLACHENSDMKEMPFHGEVGPLLDGVGSNWEEAELRGIVTNSKKTFPETIMPAFYIDAGFERPLEEFASSSILSAQDVEDVVAYLMALTDE